MPHDPSINQSKLDHYIDVLTEKGFCIIPDAMPRKAVQQLDADLDEGFRTTPFCQGGFYGELTKRFGTFTAMDHVTMRVEPGTVHALLGENGAGKSTLVKCVAGFQRAEEGSILIDGRERAIPSPVAARALGIGMVYQHFTLAPGMTVAENLLLAGGKTPAIIDWRRKQAELEDFLATTPFRLPLDRRPSELAAGGLALIDRFRHDGSGSGGERLPDTLRVHQMLARPADQR